MVALGEAVGFAQVVQLSPVPVLHVYVEPGGPVGFPPIVVLKPEQMLTLLPAFTAGTGLTVTETVSVFEHPMAEVTVTV